MTDSDWRSRKWDATHQRIYEVALQLFQQHGFERVNVGQIASAAGVSVPTFYSHYQSKEHVIMALPTTHEFAALLAGQPAELSLSGRIRRAVPQWLGTWTPEFREDALARWRIVAETPALRTRAAEFERTTAGMIAAALPGDAATRQADAVLINAYLAAFTSALLNWADCNGERKIGELLEKAYAAMRNP